LFHEHVICVGALTESEEVITEPEAQPDAQVEPQDLPEATVQPEAGKEPEQDEKGTWFSSSCKRVVLI